MFLIKTMNLYSGSLDKPKVLVLAPTGVAAININERTINSGLTIPLYVYAYAFKKEGVVVLFDEISMVSNIHLLYIQKRLCEIFVCLETQPSGDLYILLAGDLL